ncbi:MAG: pantoate--beta-alanine ligase [Pseudomonadota bacterium]
MELFTTKKDLRAALPNLKDQGLLGLVPTMGFLHEGHLQLVRQAKRDCSKVAVTIFVNPTQFGDALDLAHYPRDLERDLDLLRAENVDAVFAPSRDEIYHPEHQTHVDSAQLGGRLMGALRPGHFRGVTTVVSKLFNIIQPDRAYFGEKDYQQLLVIQTMARDLDMPLEVIGVPTHREPDGLAMSSRNVRLSVEERRAAPVLNAALNHAEAALAHDPNMSAEALRDLVRAKLATEPLAHVETVDIQDATSLADISGRLKRAAVILLAVRLGSVLLIDQRVLTPNQKLPEGQTP